MMATSQPPRSEYSPLFTQGLYSSNPASRRHLQSSSFLDVDSPSESGDDNEQSMANFAGVLRPNNASGRTVSPTPTVRPSGAGPSRPPQHRLAHIPPPAPAPNHALPSVPAPSYGVPAPPRGAPVNPGHSRSPTGASYSPADARTAALARLEGRPAPPTMQRPPQPPQPSRYGQVPQESSFLSLSDPPAGRSRNSPPRRA